MATAEELEKPGGEEERRTGSASEIDAGIARVLGFILGNIPPRTDLIKMARYGTRQVRDIEGTPWEIMVENHTTGYDLGMDTPRTRSIVMKGENLTLRLVTDWGIKRGIGLTLKDRPPLMVGLDRFSLNPKVG